MKSTSSLLLPTLVIAWLLTLGPAEPVRARSAGDTAAPFATALGRFTPQAWSDLPGWQDENHAEALAVFRRSCAALQRRAMWRGTCAAVQHDAGTDARARFEATFVPYKVTALAVDRDGLMTGYFEPVLDGSPTRRPPFEVPVLGAPTDLLLLDARRWQDAPRDGSARATIVDGQVVPAADGAPGLDVDPAVFDSEPLDRRFRVRRDGDRIVRYWTRQQIEAGQPVPAPVIAWVDDPQALYLMQVQGSGRIRMAGGRTLRLSYAEQNGHPFRPRGAAGTGTRTRSVTETITIETGPETTSADAPVAVIPVTPRTQSLIESRSLDESVNQVVDALLAQTPRPASSRSRAADARASLNLGHLVAARANDPSYVFFGASPAAGAPGGPVGALGIPLTATRSIAVDPRTTPLGAPVYIEAERDDVADPLRRLMIAQDTGGAIRGAVRADFFWGTGPEAGAQAMRTRDALAMWVLLPRDFTPPRPAASRTRSVTGPDRPATLPPACTMPDDDYC